MRDTASTINNMMIRSAQIKISSRYRRSFNLDHLLETEWTLYSGQSIYSNVRFDSDSTVQLCINDHVEKMTWIHFDNCFDISDDRKFILCLEFLYCDENIFLFKDKMTGNLFVFLSSNSPLQAPFDLDDLLDYFSSNNVKVKLIDEKEQKFNKSIFYFCIVFLFVVGLIYLLSLGSGLLILVVPWAIVTLVLGIFGKQHGVF